MSRANFVSRARVLELVPVISAEAVKGSALSVPWLQPVDVRQLDNVRAGYLPRTRFGADAGFAPFSRARIAAAALRSFRGIHSIVPRQFAAPQRQP